MFLYGALDEHLQRSNQELEGEAFGPPAKGFAFKFLVTPGKSSPLAMTLAVSSCMVVPMVIIMSLYGACEGLFHMPGGPLANLQAP